MTLKYNTEKNTLAGILGITDVALVKKFSKILKKMVEMTTQAYKDGGVVTTYQYITAIAEECDTPEELALLVYEYLNDTKRLSIFVAAELSGQDTSKAIEDVVNEIIGT